MDGRLTFQEAMRIIPLPSKGRNDDEKSIRRFMSVRSAWLPGSDIRDAKELPQVARASVKRIRAAYGAHVFSQSGIVAVRTLQDLPSKRIEGAERYGIHTIHGYWSEMGLVDRPFVYEVTPLSTAHLFPNILVTVRQPLTKSTNPSGDHYPIADASLPLGAICFTAIVSFRQPEPTLYTHQEPSAQTRFASILASRAPESWIPSPPLDIDAITAVVPRGFAGSFPAVEMRKVDMRAFNAGRPHHERRELVLYRLLAPLPPDDPSAHFLVHAYECDHNGFLMFINHAGWGWEFGRAASLSNSMVLHTNPELAVMRGDGWWIQEVLMPRSDAGRGLLHCKVWSPEGVHVATCFQDGIFRKMGHRPGKAVVGKL